MRVGAISCAAMCASQQSKLAVQHHGEPSVSWNEFTLKRGDLLVCIFFVGGVRFSVVFSSIINPSYGSLYCICSSCCFYSIFS